MTGSGERQPLAGAQKASECSLPLLPNGEQGFFFCASKVHGRVTRAPQLHDTSALGPFRAPSHADFPLRGIHDGSADTPP